MREVFWLLDVNYEVRDGVPEVWVWGINGRDERILLIVRGFKPYFYAVLEEGYKAEDVIESISRSKDRFPFIMGMEPVDRRFFGRPVKAIKITCSDPDVITKYSRGISKIKGVDRCLEDDIRYSMRYLIDNDLKPCGWHEVEVELEGEKPPNIQVDRVYLAKSTPKRVERDDTPRLRVLGFSAIYYSPKGAPKAGRSPVVMLSIATNNGVRRQLLAKNHDDREVIEAFMEYVKKFDPDIIVNYGANRMDWEYLTERSRRLGIRFSVDRVGTEPHRSVYGHVSITGRINLDLADFADELYEVKVKTLENVADYLGVMKVEERTLIEDVEVADYWDDPEKRETLAKYSMENVESIMGLYEALSDYAIELSRLVGLPLDQIGKAAVGFRVEWFLIREAYKTGELVPERVERPYIPYVGGMVLKPKPGIHENIAILDFKSMYPNIMIEYNISPDTYLPPSEPEPPSGVYTAPEVGHRFRKEPPGFYKRVLSSLISARDEVRAKLRKVDPKSVEYRVLDARQKAIKVITNATYGYAGWIGARWYRKPVAEATTAWGRKTILSTIEMAKKMGLEVIYSDTDSIFITYDPEKVESLTRMIEETLKLEIKPDKIYTRILFTEAKKRYCGLLPNGELDVVGLEVVRGDWASIARNVQEGVLEIILKERDIDKAVEFVHKFISDLKARKHPYKDLVIWKTLTKPIEKYEVRAPHVEAAKMLKREGWDITLGDKVGYVIVKGSGRLYERAKPYILTSYDEVDLDYYIEKQVIPAVLRILKQFGVTQERLRPKAPGEERIGILRYLNP